VTRFVFDAIVSTRDLWETYLPVFEACVERGAAQSVMCSYNSLNGVPTCVHAGLMGEVLRDTFNFSGFVMSDYDAWANVVETHAVSACVFNLPWCLYAVMR
jgi:beta-glucosidase